MFKKYQHIERYGTDEVNDIEYGTCYVFSKIDGTNSSVWIEDGEIHAGSRNRELSLDNDNQGFFAYILNNTNIKNYLFDHPNHRLYGEFLVKHTLKTYRDDAWNKFYVFDVVDMEKVNEEKSVYSGYLSYYEYQPLLEKYNIDYIPLMKIIKNGTIEDFRKCVESNTYLIQDGQGAGEGIVIKNYDYINKYGRTTWAKIVRNEFKENRDKKFGVSTIINDCVESLIVNKYVTAALCEKEFAKIKETGWNSKKIPELLNRIYYELINEDCWHFVKEHKNPVIDFKRLNSFCIIKIKELLPDIF